MIKTYLLVGMLCIPSIECFSFLEPKPTYYTNLQKCLVDGKKLGDDMYGRMLALGLNVRMKVWCQEIEQHGEYS